ncbi:SRPBCC family protein [Maritalea mediterranea]|uniref:SRPBCC family protein n=1 Tax=Maritalea mediterranea TaxID=2909667 RepID=A0ABS9EAI6_9HYPH|nr:SRPBCC family protein [Maritalea mediterranea]MCF4099857.1 SRPBCC family protein [Maritalea mediterranea]
MPTITVSEQFDCPPEIAFAVLTDIENLPDFIEGVISVNMLTEGPVAVGTRFRETRIMMGREAEEEMECTALEPPSLIKLYAFSHGTEYHSTYTLKPVDGGTEVTLEFKGQPKTFMAKVMSALFSKMIGQVADLLQKDLRDAKAEAEKRAQ